MSKDLIKLWNSPVKGIFNLFLFHHVPQVAESVLSSRTLHLKRLYLKDKSPLQVSFCFVKELALRMFVFSCDVEIRSQYSSILASGSSSAWKVGSLGKLSFLQKTLQKEGLKVAILLFYHHKWEGAQ